MEIFYSKTFAQLNHKGKHALYIFFKIDESGNIIPPIMRDYIERHEIKYCKVF